jgi:pimeloyl-ACP methyl ester carboxylesterase
MEVVQFSRGPEGEKLAYLEDGGGQDLGRCGFFWLGGFKSDMQGTKAEALAALARETRRPSLRFDYSGHGRSGGVFTDGTVSRWLAQTLHMFSAHAPGKRIVVGSSMGGWLAMLLVQELRRSRPLAADRIAGLVLIAPAADMTADLMWDTFPPKARNAIRDKGVWMQPSSHGEPHAITAELIEDGAAHLILDKGLVASCPVRILQGEADADVPPAHALKVFEAIAAPDISLTLIKGGDHRLSTPANLMLIRETVLRLAERADGIMV